MPIRSVGRMVLCRFGAAVFGRSLEGARGDPGALDGVGVFAPTDELWTVRREGALTAFPGRVGLAGGSALAVSLSSGAYFPSSQPCIPVACSN